MFHFIGLAGPRGELCFLIPHEHPGGEKARGVASAGEGMLRCCVRACVRVRACLSAKCLGCRSWRSKPLWSAQREPPRKPQGRASQTRHLKVLVIIIQAGGGKSRGRGCAQPRARRGAACRGAARGSHGVHREPSVRPEEREEHAGHLALPERVLWARASRSPRGSGARHLKADTWSSRGGARRSGRGMSGGARGACRPENGQCAHALARSGE